jgi:hypothetical protein
MTINKTRVPYHKKHMHQPDFSQHLVVRLATPMPARFQVKAAPLDTFKESGVLCQAKQSSTGVFKISLYSPKTNAS